MAEFLVDKLLSGLADIAVAKLQEEVKLVTGVEDEVKNLHRRLKIIRSMLQDVQRRKLKEEPIRIWLEELKDVAYDVEDVLDEWKTRVQKLKQKAEEDSNSPSLQMEKTVSLRNMVSSSFGSICSGFKEVPLRHDIAEKIKELNGRMEKIFKDTDQFKFVSSGSTSNSGEFKRIITTSVFYESEVCGREYDKDTIVSELLPVSRIGKRKRTEDYPGTSKRTSAHLHSACQSDTSDANDGVRIVSIVGTGGIGKTTLAQLVHNDNRVKGHFELTKWVCVSDPFDQIKIAKAILESPERSSAETSELETLVQRIKALISGKKFLLVLDDVWTEDDSKWKPIWHSLKHGAPGSTILVTTRKETVARMVGTNSTHPLNQLPDSDCWTILSRLALSGRSEDEREKLEGIGKEISKKCKGLPLAAKFLGSLLRFRDTVEQWQNVLESEIWELEKASIDLFPQLYLSYNELSPEMKRCFLYCAVFPKDTEIDVQELISIWMAQGYLSSSGRVGEPELRGYEYFSNLAMRSFFQNLKRDIYYEAQIIKCKMHDIVHDFATYLTNGECLVIDGKLDETKYLSCEKVRHLCGNVAASPIISDDVKKLRSFILRNDNAVEIIDLFDSLKCVRVLIIFDAQLKEVPGAIENFIHLRFLNLSRNRWLKVLPEEICNLYNLETLDISQCEELTELPERIGNLINLRCLLNGGTYSLKQLPQSLEKLTSLRTLQEFKVGNGYNTFDYLKNLKQLRGTLWIDFYVMNEVDFDIVTLGDKTGIKTMAFYFWGEETNYELVTGYLQAPPNLEVLILFDYPNSNLPRWIMSLNNVRRLHIHSCKDLAALPALGQLPSLEDLRLEFLHRIEVLGHEFLGITENPAAVGFPIFPKLKKLYISGLDNLKEWEDLREEDENIVSAVMPRLQELQLRWCAKLKKLPHRLLHKAPSLNSLFSNGCLILEGRYWKDRGGEDWSHISHIPNVQF